MKKFVSKVSSQPEIRMHSNIDKDALNIASLEVKLRNIVNSVVVVLTIGSCCNGRDAPQFYFIEIKNLAINISSHFSIP